MAIPDYQTIILPLLRFAGDQQEHSLREAVNQLAERYFKLTEEERKDIAKLVHFRCEMWIAECRVNGN